MSQITHPELVSALCKSGADIATELNNNKLEKALLMNAVESVMAEGGYLERCKKRVIYNKKDNESDPETGKLYPNITAKQAHLLHMAIGITGEAIELLEQIYTHTAEGEELDYENVLEELGDLEFYIEGFRQGCQINRETALNQNIAKLSKRYSSLSYSDSAAQERADKVEA